MFVEYGIPNSISANFGKIVRSKPAIPPTKAFTITRIVNCNQFSFSLSLIFLLISLFLKEILIQENGIFIETNNYEVLIVLDWRIIHNPIHVIIPLNNSSVYPKLKSNHLIHIIFKA